MRPMASRSAMVLTTSVPSRSRATAWTSRAYQERGSGLGASVRGRGGPRSGSASGVDRGWCVVWVTDCVTASAGRSDHDLSDVGWQERAEQGAKGGDEGPVDGIADTRIE